MRGTDVSVVIVFLLGAALLGMGTVFIPYAVLPLGLEGLILLGITLLIVRAEGERSTRSWLTGLVAGALGVRLLLIVPLHFAFSPYVFAPDARTYEFYGRVVREYLLGIRGGLGGIEGSWQAAYHYLNGVAFYLFGGETPLAPVVLNTFASVWTAILVFYLARHIRDEATGKVLAVLVAFFPSLVLWSVLNIRDALSTFLVVVATLLVVRARRDSPVVNGVLALGVLLILSTFRDYMGLLVGAGLGLALLAAVRPGKILRTLVAGVVLVVGLVLVAETSGVLQRFPVEGTFEVVTALREDMTRGAGSAFATEREFGGAMDALSFLPLGITFFLFAPFPWAVSSPLQMAALPETLLWYALVPFTIGGMRIVLRERRPGALFPFTVALVVIAAYALVEGNVGTAYRHRAQIMPLLFFFTAVGMRRWWQRLRKKTRGRARPSRGRGGTPPRGRGGGSGDGGLRPTPRGSGAGEPERSDGR